MKKKITLIITCAIVLIALDSCKKDLNQKLDGPLSKETSLGKVNSIPNSVNTIFTNLQNNYLSRFDLKTAKWITPITTQPDLKCIVVESNLYLEAAPAKEVVAFYLDENNDLIGAFGILTEKIDNTNFTVTYSNLADEVIGTVHINTLNQSVTTTEPTNPGYISTELGRATMRCISDAYNNHGLISVWLYVQSAFIPATAAAISLACAGHNPVFSLPIEIHTVLDSLRAVPIPTPIDSIP